ncbi:VOC family protein [Nakamurella leprariae]|uniref:Uncharacterized protein n=1 Tax=Nakamurella leprariae TaxID=2803911 RepID=A0A938YFZ9_9ACTN|nr:hypothetical protein [Nakamurella leprariae]MBM9467692.1 hypothetical protein [Nakamurella leprariae]
MPDRSSSRIDELNIAVPDLAAATAFSEPVLASIGISTMLVIPAAEDRTHPAMTGSGWPDRTPYFWLVDEGTGGTDMHLAFTVDDRSEVDAFHAAALAAVPRGSRLRGRERPARHQPRGGLPAPGSAERLSRQRSRFRAITRRWIWLVPS